MTLRSIYFKCSCGHIDTMPVWSSESFEEIDAYVRWRVAEPCDTCIDAEASQRKPAARSPRGTSDEVHNG